MNDVEYGLAVRHAIERARGLLSDPARWTRGGYAKTAEGLLTGSSHSNAVCWCLAGALRKEAYELLVAPSSVAEAFAKATGIRDIPVFNDNLQTTHDDILAALDKAIGK